MGLNISLPGYANTLSFVDPETCDSMGQVKDEDVVENAYAGITARLFKDILSERLEMNEAKEKFRRMNFEKILKLYPNWTKDDILDLKAQFQTFDMNQDGLIDFKELCVALDEVGDTSSPQEREVWFIELDQDGSGAVDFDEYLTLFDNIREKGITASSAEEEEKKKKKKTMEVELDQHNKTQKNVRRMSIVHQLNNGLF